MGDQPQPSSAQRGAAILGVGAALSLGLLVLAFQVQRGFVLSSLPLVLAAIGTTRGTAIAFLPRVRLMPKLILVAVALALLTTDIAISTAGRSALSLAGFAVWMAALVLRLHAAPSRNGIEWLADSAVFLTLIWSRSASYPVLSEDSMAHKYVVHILMHEQSFEALPAAFQGFPAYHVLISAIQWITVNQLSLDTTITVLNVVAGALLLLVAYAGLNRYQNVHHRAERLVSNAEVLTMVVLVGTQWPLYWLSRSVTYGFGLGVVALALFVNYLMLRQSSCERAPLLISWYLLAVFTALLHPLLSLALLLVLLMTAMVRRDALTYAIATPTIVIFVWANQFSTIRTAFRIIEGFLRGTDAGLLSPAHDPTLPQGNPTILFEANSVSSLLMLAVLGAALAQVSRDAKLRRVVLPLVVFAIATVAVGYGSTLLGITELLGHRWLVLAAVGTLAIVPALPAAMLPRNPVMLALLLSSLVAATLHVGYWSDSPPFMPEAAEMRDLTGADSIAVSWLDAVAPEELKVAADPAFGPAVSLRYHPGSVIVTRDLLVVEDVGYAGCAILRPKVFDRQIAKRPFDLPVIGHWFASNNLIYSNDATRVFCGAR